MTSPENTIRTVSAKINEAKNTEKTETRWRRLQSKQSAFAVHHSSLLLLSETNAEISSNQGY